MQRKRVAAVAALLGVKPTTVQSWARSGLLEFVERGRPGHSYRFRLDAATLKRLRAEKQAMDQRHGPFSGKKVSR